MTPLYWRELQDADLSKVMLVDVRTSEESALSAVPGAVNIPLDDLRERMGEIPKDRPIYLFCEVGLRGYLASNILKGHGYKDVRNLIGGLKTYKAATSPVPVPSANEIGTKETCCSAASLQECGEQTPRGHPSGCRCSRHP